MRTKNKPTSLEAFLAEREQPSSITTARLHKDLLRAVEELRVAAGSSPEVNGALLSILLQPIRQLAEDLAAIERMGRREQAQESVPFNTLGQLQRWLITPTQKRAAARRIAGWSGTERFYELPRRIAGRDFVILNNTQRGPAQLRAWSRKLYEPRAGAADPAPDQVVELFESLAVPRRRIETAKIRLLLAYGQKRVEHPWIELAGQPTWKAERAAGKAERTLPQSYVAATLPILGPKFGVRVEEDGKERLRVTWAGAALLHETVRIADWIGRTGA